MLKKLLFMLGTIIVLSGCSKNINTQNKDIETSSGDFIDNNSGLTLSEENLENEKNNNLSPDVIEELNTLYNAKLVFRNINRIGDFIVADANDGNNQPDSGILIVVAKINGKWIKLYEGNSGEISCSLVEKYDFPKELLGNCTIGADYTIPQESLPFANK